jgi:hypothetical protein
VPYGSAIDQEVREMLNGDVARYRVEDMLHHGELQRAARPLAEQRTTARKALARRLVATTAALFPLPIKH